MNVLELKKVNKSYKRGGFWGNKDHFKVLQNINLSLHKGSCAGLLGRSGSGKSTLGRVALDLEKPDNGELLYYGKSVRHLNPSEYRDFRRNVQVVFQNPLGSVNPRFTALRIVTEPFNNFESLSNGQVRRRAGELLEQVGLSPTDFDKYPHQFSGGELQRICIARAIALNPSLIILDEAVSSLDMLIQLKILDLLIHLKKELGTTYLFISHDIRILLKISDRILVMHEGQLVEQMSSPENMSRINHHDAFRSLVDAVLPSMPVAAN